ncbi:MAG: isoprenylcysteine carboxylmethyltransferase family protein [Alphaproteobacteria bacterium]|nr:isoprenylcysteine carboxylmethyltransferase family protein [Alphaproteobacteria bacterium]
MSDNQNEDNPGLIMPPPYFLGIALVAAFVGQNLWPVIFLPRGLGWAFYLGLLLIICAMALAVSGVREFGKQGTNVRPTQPAINIVTSGPFQHIRNPMYAGFLLLLAGVGFVIALEWALLLVPVLWVALHVLVVTREERYLTAKFGAEYEAYLGQVRRWGLF